MKFILASLILIAAASAFAAQKGDEAGERGPGATEAASADANACSGSCINAVRSINFSESGPEEVNKAWEKIEPKGRVITPEELQKGKAVNEGKPIDM